MDELTPPHGFGPDEAEAVIEASEAAFATLAVLEGTTDWRSADAFPRRFSSEVAGYLVNGHGIVPAAAAPGDRQASAAVRIVERAARYAALEIAQAGGNTLTPSEQRLMDAFRQQAYDLSRKPAKAAAFSVAVCRLLRDMFARIGIPADSLPDCTCVGDSPGDVAGETVTGVPTSPTSEPPGWIAKEFKQQQQMLLYGLWGKGIVTDGKLLEILNMNGGTNPEENLKRLCVRVNDGLNGKSNRIVGRWCVTQVTDRGEKCRRLERLDSQTG